MKPTQGDGGDPVMSQTPVATVPAEPAGWRRAFDRDGIALFPACEPIRRWAAAARAAAAPRVAAPEQRALWLRCEGTWFAGVDLLPNGPDGAVDAVPLGGPVLAAIADLGLMPATWHAAQVSVTYPGYPRPREGESPGAARYRLRRDAAHLDGLLPVGPDRRRMLREPHAFVLGLPLQAPHAQAAPLVVWLGSHRVMGQALRAARQAQPDRAAGEIDLTETYAAARREVFARCVRQEMPAEPGQAIMLHRHLLHGIAPWRGAADATGRMTAYFRPLLTDAEAWFA